MHGLDGDDIVAVATPDRFGLARLAFPAVGFDWLAEDIAHLIGVAIPAVTSYFGHRHFSFSSRRPGDA